MEKKLINSIQNDFFKITSVKISKIYIKNKILPVFRYLNESKRNMFLFSGSQGVGKTTFIKILHKNFNKYYNKKILTLSLDDFYYTKNYRKKLSQLIHPLMVTRGVPGTHDIKKLKGHIEKFEKKHFPILTPTFNKLKDDISNKTKIINKADILILEGWCCGANPIENKFLYKNLNRLERELDKEFKWRKYYNLKLKNEYQKIFKSFDKIIYIQPPSFQFVLKWRYAQEKNNAKKTKNKIFMNKNTTRNFILYYEKLTKWMLKNMPAKADMLIKVDKNQKIIRITNYD